MSSPLEDDALDIMGCTDELACNYDANANVDDGSCTFAESNYDCSGNCTAGEDCAGECNGNASVDECGICHGDNSTCSGCMDEMANNYDPDATIDDGSCNYMAFGEPSLPSSYNLKPNYPNPFNPVTTISFSIPELKLITIKVFDIGGNEVKILLNEDLNVGNYSIIWNAFDETSGVYLIRMISGEFTYTQKVVLIK